MGKALIILFVFLNPLKDFNTTLRLGPVDWYNFFYLLWVLLWIFKNDIGWMKTPINKYFSWFIFFFIFSYLRGFFPPFSVDQAINVQHLKNIVTEVFLFFIFLNFIQEKKTIKNIIFALAIVMTYESFVVINQYREAMASIGGGGFTWELKSRITGTFLVGGGGTGTASANEVGAFFSLYTLLIGGYAVFCENKKVKYCLFSLCGLFTLPMMFSQSRGAWLGFGFTIILFLLRKNKKLLIVFITAFLLMLPLLPSSVVDRGSSVEDKSAQGRLDLWKEAAGAMTNPAYFLVGIGFNKANRYLDMDAHNSYVRIMIESGMGGLACWLLLLYNVYTFLYKNMEKCNDPTTKGFLFGLLLSLTCFMVLNCVGTRLYNGAVAATMWGLIGIAVKANIIYEKERGKNNQCKATKK